MYLNTNEPRTMHFDVNIQGVDFKQLQGSLRFNLEDIQYGFPVNILRDHIEVDVPPLDEIIKKGLIDGETIECQLDVFGEGFYMQPWTGHFELKRRAVIEAKMTYNDTTSPESPMKTMVEATMIEEKIEDKVIEKKLVVEEDIKDGDETSQLIKLLEKLVSKRLSIPEGTTLLPKDKTKNKTHDNKDIDVSKGIMGKRGKRDIVIEPPDEDGKIEKESKANKKLQIMDSLVEKFLTRANLKDKPQKVQHKIREKAKRVIEQKLANRQSQKKEKTQQTLKPYIFKEAGDIITESDIHKLFKSVGMTKQSSQERIIEVAKKMGGDDISGIYHSLKRIVKPTKSPSSYEEFIKSMKEPKSST